MTVKPEKTWSALKIGLLTIAALILLKPAVWERRLLLAGFVTAEAAVVESPEPGHIGTLIVRATA